MSGPAQPGTMKAMVGSFDWARTPLGPIDAWPESIAAVVRLMLASPLPMCLLVGPTGILVYNDGYIAIAGDRHPEILGMAALDAWPEAADFNRNVLEKGLAGETLHYKDLELTLIRSEGGPEAVWLDLDYSPVLDARGQPIAVFALLSETTARIVAERALERSNEELSFALAASGAVGAWDLDLESGKIVADARFAEIFGVRPEEAALGVPIASYLNGIHPDDRAQLEERIAASVAAAGDFRAEYRITGGDIAAVTGGGSRWVMALGRVLNDSQGKPKRLAGVVVDITERKAAEQALAASEAGFRALADSMPQMVWSTRADGFHDYYNARWYEFTGMPPGSTDGAGWNGMFHADDQERAWTAWRHSLETGELYQVEYRLRHHSGEYRWTLGRALPVRDERGRITRWFGTCTDIHESRLAAEEREVIAQELSHRIKNIFSVLTGIIALSARAYPDVKPFADELRQRISAMGKAHDLVRPHSDASRPARGHSSLQALVEQLVAPFDDPDHPRVFFSGPDTQIDDGSATPVSLFIHELATNAAKYGALTASDGRVAITASSDETRYHLVWKEMGGPAIAHPPHSEGFGSRLMGLSVEGQLSGTLSRTWEPDGLRVELSVPLAALNRSANLRQKAH